MSKEIITVEQRLARILEYMDRSPEREEYAVESKTSSIEVTSITVSSQRNRDNADFDNHWDAWSDWSNRD